MTTLTDVQVLDDQLEPINDSSVQTKKVVKKIGCKK